MSFLQECLRKCLMLKDCKILFIAHAVFTVSLSIAIIIIEQGLTTTVPITNGILKQLVPLYCTAIMIFLTGFLFLVTILKKKRFLVYSTLVVSLISFVFCLLSFAPYLQTVLHLKEFSRCSYASDQRACTCVVTKEDMKASYIFPDTDNCDAVTIHFKEICCGLLAIITFSYIACLTIAGNCYSTIHKQRIDQLKLQWKNRGKQELTMESVENTELLPDKDDHSSPWKRDMATQTSREKPRKKCSHFVEVNVPDVRKQYIMNATKSRDPPPPYCEEEYTKI